MISHALCIRHQSIVLGIGNDVIDEAQDDADGSCKAHRQHLVFVHVFNQRILDSFFFVKLPKLPP